MNANLSDDFDDDDASAPPACRAARAAMNARLDGDAPDGTSPALEGHLPECAACSADWAVLRLLLDAPIRAFAPDPARAARLARAVGRDRAVTRAGRRAVGGFALALAACLAWLMLARPGAVAPPEVPTPEVVRTNTVPAPEPDGVGPRQPLGPLADAGAAALALTRRAAFRAVERTGAALPLPEPFTGETLPPAAGPLDGPAAGARLALAPVTDSTRRAFAWVSSEFVSASPQMP